MNWHVEIMDVRANYYRRSKTHTSVTLPFVWRTNRKLSLWASRLGSRAKKRNKHARPNIIFVDLWSQTHQNIHSRKIFYNACSVAMLSARMLMLCSGAQWSSSTWSVWRTRELLFIWWAPRFHIKADRYRELQHFQSAWTFSLNFFVDWTASISDSSTLLMLIAVASSSKY